MTFQKGHKFYDGGEKTWFKKGESRKTGNKTSEETKEKQRQAKLNNPTRFWLGKKRSPETIAKISENRRGKGGESKRVDKLLFICPKCKKELWLLPCFHKNRKACSMLCANGGEKNHRWKGGITSQVQKDRHTLEIKQWRIAVFIRDCKTCRHCGIKSTRKIKINAHHIKPFSTHPDLRVDIENGITLCVRCHRIVHGWKIDEDKYINYSVRPTLQPIMTDIGDHCVANNSKLI